MPSGLAVGGHVNALTPQVLKVARMGLEHDPELIEHERTEIVNETLKLVDGPGAPTFTRNSPAYLNGEEVASGEPRHPFGENILPRGNSLGEAEWNTFVHQGVDMEYVDRDTEGVPPDPMFDTDTILKATITVGFSGGRRLLNLILFNPNNSLYKVPFVPGRHYRVDMRLFITAPFEGVIWVINHAATVGGMPVSSSNAHPQVGEWHTVRALFSPNQNYEGDVVRGFCRPTGGGVTVPVGAVYYQGLAQVTEVDGSDDPPGPVMTPPFRPGGPSAILIEEGTENLLPAARSRGEDASGTASATISYDTTDKVVGASSVQVETTEGGNNDGVRFIIVGSVGSAGEYSGLVVVKGDVGNICRPVVRNLTQGASGQEVIHTFTGGWDVIPVPPIACGVGDSVAVQVINSTNPAVEQTFRVDRAQIEAKPYATSWHPGGSTRNSERADVPVEVIDLDEGTAEIDFYMPSDVSGLETPKTLLYMGETSSTRMAIRFGTTPGSILVNGNSALSVENISEGWHRASVWWDMSNNDISLTFDGILINMVSLGFDMSTVNVCTIGSDRGTADRRAGVPIAAVRLSSGTRSAAELADWRKPLEADGHTTYLLNFEDNLKYGMGGAATLPLDLSGITDIKNSYVRWNGHVHAIEAVVDGESFFAQNAGKIPGVQPGTPPEDLKVKVHLASSDVDDEDQGYADMLEAVVYEARGIPT